MAFVAEVKLRLSDDLKSLKNDINKAISANKISVPVSSLELDPAAISSLSDSISKELAKRPPKIKISISEVKIDTSKIKSAIEAIQKDGSFNAGSLTFSNVKIADSFYKDFAKRLSQEIQAVLASVQSVATDTQNSGTKKASPKSSQSAAIIHNEALAITKQITDISSKHLKEIDDYIKKISDSYERLSDIISKTNAKANGTGSSRKAKEKSEVKKIEDFVSRQDVPLASQIDRLTDFYAKLQNPETKNAFAAQINYLKELQRYAANGDSASFARLLGINDIDTTNLSEVRKAMRRLIADNIELKTSATEAGDTEETLSQKTKRIFSQKFGYGLMATAAMYLRRALSDIVKVSIELDAKFTDLEIVLGKNASEMRNYRQEVIATAKEIGASAVDLADAATVYARLGFSLGQSLDLAKFTTMYSKLADVNVDDAERAITAIVKAFDINTNNLENVMDKLTYVGNNFPVSAAELGEGLNNAASALASAGNSFEESLAILTAANTTVQDISKASTAVRTITARIRTSSTDLEELGETLEDDYNTVAKYRAKLLGITGVDILASDNKTFRSTYDILNDLAEAWERLSDIDKSSVTTMLAGTRQQNVFQSLMGEWDEARKVIAEMNDANGALQRGQEIYINSVEGRIEQFKATFQEISDSMMEQGGVVSSAIRIGDVLLNIVGILAKIPGIVDIIAASIATIGITKLGTTIFDFGGKLLKMLTGQNGIIPMVKLAAQTGNSGLGALAEGLNASAKSAGFASASFSAAGIAIAGLAAAVSIAIIAFNAYEQRIQEANNAAKEAMSSLGTNAKDLKELSNEFTSLRQSLDGSNLSYDEAQSTRERLIEIQNELIENYGAERGAIDLVTGSIDKQREAIESLSEEEWKKAYRSNKGATDDAIDFIYGNGFSGETWKDNVLNRYFAFGYALTTEYASSISNIYDALEAYEKLYETLVNAGRDSDARTISQDIDALEKMISEKESIVNPYLEGLLKYDQQYSGIYANITKAQSDLNNALAAGDISGIESALSALASIDPSAIDNEAVREYVEHLIDEIQKAANAYQVKLKVKADVDTAGIAKQVNDAFGVKGADGKTVINSSFILGGIGFSPEQQSAYNALLDLSQKYGISISETISLLNEFGYVSENVYTSAADAIGKVSSAAEGMQKAQSALNDASKDMSDDGFLSYESIKKLEDAGLDKYILHTADGYKLADGALKDYLNTQRAQYTAAVTSAKNAAIAIIKQNSLVSMSYDASTKEIVKQLKAQKALHLASAQNAYLELYKVSISKGHQKEILQDILGGYADAFTERIDQAISDIENAEDQLKEFDAILKTLERDEKNSGSATEKYIATLESLYLANRKIAEEEEALSRIQERLTNEDEKNYRTRSKIIESEIAQLSRLNIAIQEGIAARKSQIESNASILGGYGFDVDYDADTSRFLVKNYNQLNEIMDRYAASHKMSTESANELKKSVEELIKDTQTLNDDNTKAAKDFRDNAQKSRTELNALFTEYQNAVTQMTDVFDMLKNAAKEFSENGYLTVDTLKAITSAGLEYLYYLKDENGQLIINEESIRNVIKARTEEMAVESALNYISQIRIALEQKDAEALARLTNQTTNYAQSTWASVYAQLALLDLTEDQYNAAVANIQKLQSITDNVVSNIDSSISTSTKNLSDSYKESQSALEDLLKYVEQMIKQEAELAKDALEKQIDDYKEIIDLKKEQLDLTKEDDDYEKSVSEKTKEIAKLQAQIDLLSLDTSREAKAERASLEEQLAKLQDELAEKQSDRQIDMRKKALDEEADAFEEEKRKEIDEIDRSISSEEKLYQLAIKRINEQWDTLYEDLINWNYEYGSDTQSTMESAWAKASEAVQKYGGYLEAVVALQNSIKAIDSGSGTISTSGGTTNPGINSSEARSVLQKMKANSTRYKFSTAAEQSALADENTKLAAQLSALTGQNITRKSDGYWYLPNGQALYSINNEDIVKAAVAEMKKNSAAYPSLSESGKEAAAKRNEEIAKVIAQLTGKNVHRDYNGVWKIGNDNLYEVYHKGGVVSGGNAKSNEVLALLEKGEFVLNREKIGGLYKIVDFTQALSEKLGTAIGTFRAGNIASQITSAIKSGVSGDVAPSMVVSTSVNVSIYHNGDMSDADASNYGSKIADATLGKLKDAFTKRGIRNIMPSTIKK